MRVYTPTLVGVYSLAKEVACPSKVLVHLLKNPLQNGDKTSEIPSEEGEKYVL
jgi:hypothetical protein